MVEHVLQTLVTYSSQQELLSLFRPYSLRGHFHVITADLSPWVPLGVWPWLQWVIYAVIPCVKHEPTLVKTHFKIIHLACLMFLSLQVRPTGLFPLQYLVTHESNWHHIQWDIPEMDIWSGKVLVLWPLPTIGPTSFMLGPGRNARRSQTIHWRTATVQDFKILCMDEMEVSLSAEGAQYKFKSNKDYLDPPMEWKNLQLQQGTAWGSSRQTLCSPPKCWVLDSVTRKAMVLLWSPRGILWIMRCSLG